MNNSWNNFQSKRSTIELLSVENYWSQAFVFFSIRLFASGCRIVLHPHQIAATKEITVSKLCMLQVLSTRRAKQVVL